MLYLTVNANERECETVAAEKTTRKARIHIRSLTTDLIFGGDPEEISYAADAEISFDGRDYTVSYPEPLDTGIGDAVTSLVFSADAPGVIAMNRAGDSMASLVFNSAVRRQPCAVNAAGTGFEFVIYTRRAENGVTLDGGVIDLDYVLEFRAIKTERNQLHIELTPEDKGE